MNDISCAYAGDREQTLIAYVYDDIDPAERTAFDAHLETCARCRHDLDALGGVRRQLARWSPPEPNFGVRNPHSSIRASRSWWRDVPGWAQVAAALLFLGVAAGVANLDVRYDRGGLSIRTGWSKTTAGNAAANLAKPPNLANDPAPWRAELTALEQRLRSEGVRAVQPQPAQPARTGPSADAEVLRRVRALVEESERRQQRELALRIAEVFRDVNAQRRADLTKIDRNLGLIQSSTGVEILRQRETLNYLMKVSQRQ